MKKNVVFYSKEEKQELLNIRANFSGKERTQVLTEWAKNHNRNLPGVTAKMYTIKGKVSNTLVVQNTKDIVLPGKGGTIRIGIKSITITNGEMVINY